LLKELKDLEVIQARGPLETPVGGVSCHSEAVEPGHLFVAIPGTHQDGHRFVRRAMERGAVGSLVERVSDELPEAFTQIQVNDARRALARVAASYYGHPARDIRLVGITGTNGKTTTASLLESILKDAGLQVGLLGTIEYRYGARSLQASTTTPGSLELQRILRVMVDAGITHAVMEVTSHALDQDRVLGCDFQGAVFTNLTRDHLDYHGNMDAYLDAKIRLFEEHLLPESEGGWAVINAEAPTAGEIQKRCRGRIIRFGFNEEAEFRALKWTADLNGIEMLLRYPDGEMDISTPLIGRPNLLNALAACACAWALGVEPSHWAEGLRFFSRIPGRFEAIPNEQRVTVIVDYAHTPDALEQVLSAARTLTDGRLICVFGCGGDRDQGKRPLMAQAAARHSDLIVITSDNPRTEEPRRIIDQIVDGLRELPFHRRANSNHEAVARFPSYAVIEDRGKAIHKAIKWAQAGDLVLIAGKGHETIQIVGSRRIPFDDCEMARRALGEVEA
jgi:UDP-N-acetylmuramyl-tripeptide synthetase